MQATAQVSQFPPSVLLVEQNVAMAMQLASRA
jgi:ABC-type branched-subunit amino acid transport system ATPase component